jgi:hypothetical protein
LFKKYFGHTCFGAFAIQVGNADFSDFPEDRGTVVAKQLLKRMPRTRPPSPAFQISFANNPETNILQACLYAQEGVQPSARQASDVHRCWLRAGIGDTIV